MKKPTLALTLGDPCGIGPEVLLKSLSSKKVVESCHPLVVGDAQILGLKNWGTSLKIRPILNPLEARYKPGIVDVLHIPSEKSQQFILGKPSRESGKSSFLSVQKSIELALLGLVDGVVHGPISKLAWKWAGVPYPGQTEMIAEQCHNPKVAMAILSEPLRTVLVTRHIPLKKVSQELSIKNIGETLSLTHDWLKNYLKKSPSIGVCALNPHAGESGTIGREEIKIIIPAIKQAQKKVSWSIVGPLSADAAFRDHKNGFYDALITLYHDQSLIPLKLFNCEALVNLTIGLPFPRTSPGHGTAFDIAGKNKASEQPMIAAILCAVKMVNPNNSVGSVNRE